MSHSVCMATKDDPASLFTMSNRTRSHRFIDLDIGLLVKEGFVAESKIESGVEAVAPHAAGGYMRTGRDSS